VFDDEEMVVRIYSSIVNLSEESIIHQILYQKSDLVSLQS